MRLPAPSRLTRGLAGAALVVAALAAATTACASGGGRARTASGTPASAGDAASALEGEWRLTALQLGDGTSRRVTGFLRFDRFSNITVRAELAPDEPAARPPRTVIADFIAKARAGGSEFDYAGLSMGVGPERLTEDAATMAEWRHYELTGDTLRVSARDRAGRVAATLVFERIR